MTLLIVAALVIWTRNDPLRSAARREWRDEALAKIERRVDDTAWLESEVSRLRINAGSEPEGGWVGKELLVMKNGDWIVCQNVCAKEKDTGVKKDLFIGRGSDGQWYYSTFHFCVGKSVLRMERQPDSLAQFVEGYWLAPFGAGSDKSLEVTWDGGPFGDEKLQLIHAPISPR